MVQAEFLNGTKIRTSGHVWNPYRVLMQACYSAKVNTCGCIMASTASAGVSTSEYMYFSREQRMLKKKQVEELIEILGTIDNGEIIQVVKRDVGSGYHLKLFPDRCVLEYLCW